MSGSMASVPPSEPDGPEAPRRPTAFRLHGVYKRVREVQETDGRTGERVRRRRARFDARYTVDGRTFRYGFDQRGWAEDFARHLQEGFARGWLFDPSSRRFLDPGELDDDQDVGPTYFEHATQYLARKWLTKWEPATRRNAQRELARACIHLVRTEAPQLTPKQRVDADAYLRAAPLMIPQPETLTAEQCAWQEWFARWSLPLAEITDEHLHDLLEELRTSALDGTRRELSASSLARAAAVVKGSFTNAVERRLIDWNPFNAVESISLRDTDRVDPDLVMDPQQVRTVAAACAEINPRYEAFVLIQGFCGLRPGEAVALQRRNIGYRDGRPVTVTGRTSDSALPARFYAANETRRRPLKGRGQRFDRTIPLPTEIGDALERHLAEFVEDRPDALVFTNTVGRRLNLSTFGRDVWEPVRRRLFADDDPLRNVRRHDLRHAAITAWLNAGVPLKTAQLWSGHSTTSVLLDTYLGVMQGDDALGLARFEALLTVTHGNNDPMTSS